MGVGDYQNLTTFQKYGTSTIIVTKETTQIVRKWAKKMNVAKLYDGIQQKELMVDTICSKYNVKPEELVYIGDDVNDVKLLKEVGLSAAPADSIREVKKICDYVCETNSGNGVFREVCDLILSQR